MTIQNQEKFLDHLVGQLGRKRITEVVERPKWTVQPQYRVLKDAFKEELVAVLEKQCGEIHTDFIKTDMENLNGTLKETLQYYNAKSIISASGERLEKFGLNIIFQELTAGGMVVHLWESNKGKENLQFAQKADIGITFSDLTLAESGTVTLLNDKENGRAISLLPQNYIAIIPKSTLVPRLTQASAIIHQQHENGIDVASCVSFVTGPSNSADIEMNLIVGVHGPVAATYILVEDM